MVAATMKFMVSTAAKEKKKHTTQTDALPILVNLNHGQDHVGADGEGVCG